MVVLLIILTIINALNLVAIGELVRAANRIADNIKKRRSLDETIF